MNSEKRNFIISCCALFLSLVAGLCSLYVYNDNQRYREEAAISSITNQIYKLKLGNENMKEEELEKELMILLTKLSCARRDIRKPLDPRQTRMEWKEAWKGLDRAVKGAIENNYKEYEKNIENAWKGLLKKKGVEL